MNLTSRRRAGAPSQNLGLAGGGAGCSIPGYGQSGTGFPDGWGCGKCVPEFAFGMGCGFRLRGQAETTSHNLRSDWDALSQQGINRKLHPTLRPRNGMRFPVEGPGGNCDPESGLRVGYGFQNRSSLEAISRKWPVSCENAFRWLLFQKMRHAVGENETRNFGCQA